jgi:hypothetical protein
MYMVHLKSAIVEALKNTFDAAYVEEDFRNLLVSIEYPMTQADYPSMWVTYEDEKNIQIAGIGYHEEVVKPDGSFAMTTRWRFEGEVTITCVAMTSLEKDRLYDELVRTLAFGSERQSTSRFRRRIESNDFIAMNMNFDDLRPSGDGANLGTPWATEEMVYEKSLSIQVLGEFIGDPETQQLVRLSGYHVQDYEQGTPEPPFPDEPFDDYLDPGDHPAIWGAWT